MFSYYNPELEVERESLEGVCFQISSWSDTLHLTRSSGHSVFYQDSRHLHVSIMCQTNGSSEALGTLLDKLWHGGILLRPCEPYDTVFDFWNASELVEPDYRKDHATITLAIFSDSIWRDEKPTRKSTSPGMIFMNGCLIHSICRSQDTIGLSSCEADVRRTLRCQYHYG